MRNSIFRDVLESIRDRVDGTLAVSLIALDGIAIESISSDSVPLDIIGAEFGGFIKSVRLSNTDLRATFCSSRSSPKSTSPCSRRSRRSTFCCS